MSLRPVRIRTGAWMQDSFSLSSLGHLAIRPNSWRLFTALSLIRERAVKSRQLLGLMARWPRLDKEKLSCIQAPVLILTGRRDMIRPRHSLWMGEQIPDSKVVFVKGADHFTLLKKERAYAGHIVRWLREKGL